MVIQGNVSIEKADYWGNRHIMTYVSAGEIFGEAYACSNDKTSNVEVVAADKCIVAFLDTYKVMTVCSSSCQFHSKLIHNLIYMLADRCVVMNEKITHLSKRSTKEKYCHIYQQEPPNVGVMSSIYHLTGSSWLIIFQLTGVQCQQN